MSYLDKMSELKKNVNKIKESTNSNLDIIKLYCSFYIVVKTKKQKELLIKNALYILDDLFINVKNHLKFILEKNIIIEKKKICVCNWIFIDEKIVVREIHIEKVNNSYLVSKINQFFKASYKELEES